MAARLPSGSSSATRGAKFTRSFDAMLRSEGHAGRPYPGRGSERQRLREAGRRPEAGRRRDPRVLVERVRELYEALGREDVQAVQDREKAGSGSLDEDRPSSPAVKSPTSLKESK